VGAEAAAAAARKVERVAEEGAAAEVVAGVEEEAEAAAVEAVATATVEAVGRAKEAGWAVADWEARAVAGSVGAAGVGEEAVKVMAGVEEAETVAVDVEAGWALAARAEQVAAEGEREKAEDWEAHCAPFQHSPSRYSTSLTSRCASRTR